MDLIQIQPDGFMPVSCSPISKDSNFTILEVHDTRTGESVFTLATLDRQKPGVCPGDKYIDDLLPELPPAKDIDSDEEIEDIDSCDELPPDTPLQMKRPPKKSRRPLDKFRSSSHSFMKTKSQPTLQGDAITPSPWLTNPPLQNGIPGAYENQPCFNRHQQTLPNPGIFPNHQPFNLTGPPGMSSNVSIKPSFQQNFLGSHPNGMEQRFNPVQGFNQRQNRPDFYQQAPNLNFNEPSCEQPMEDFSFQNSQRRRNPNQMSANFNGHASNGYIDARSSNNSGNLRTRPYRGMGGYRNFKWTRGTQQGHQRGNRFPDTKRFRRGGRYQRFNGGASGSYQNQNF